MRINLRSNTTKQKKKRIHKNTLKAILLLFVFSLFGFTPAATNYSQNMLITVENDTELYVAEVFELIHEQLGYKFVYSDHLIENAPLVELKKGEIAVKKLIKKSINPIGLTFDFSEDQTVIVKKNANFSDASLNNILLQTYISGKILDQDGAPLAGATILIQNTNRGTSTDFDGNYQIQASKGDVLVISYVGYTTKRITVGDNTTIDIQLQISGELEEVIVTGYETQQKNQTAIGVSTINASEISEFTPTTTADNLLQGKIAGVQVTGANGRPGNIAFVTIRGIGSVSATKSPLYIVDGVPIQATSVAGINIEDIVSYSVLKDAASVARYGARGANGVIILNTKKGNFKGRGKSEIKFKSTVAWTERLDDGIDYMDSEQKIRFEHELLALGINRLGDTPPTTLLSEERLDILRSRNTDWEDVLLRKGFIRSNNLSFTGGDDRVNYYLSLSHDEDSGIVKHLDGYERLAARLNTEYKAKDWLKIGANVAVSRSTHDLSRIDHNGTLNPFSAAQRLNAYDTPYELDDDGNYILDEDGERIFATPSQPFLGSPEQTRYNPLEALFTEVNERRELLTVGNFSADIKISDVLSNRVFVGLSNIRRNVTDFSKPRGTVDRDTGDPEFPGLLRESQSINFEYNVSNYLTFEKLFNKNHYLKASYLFEYNERNQSSFGATGRGFSTDEIPYLSAAALPVDTTSSENESAIYSQGLFADYNYQKKYFLSASIRRDGSSRFGPNNRYGNFYSVALSWELIKEPFMKNTPFDSMRLRTSYGTSGNDSIGDFNYLDLLGFTTYNGNLSVSQSTHGNPDIQWEAQRLFDVGLEFKIFNIDGLIEYFVRNSDNLLLDRGVSNLIGDVDNSITYNVGEIQNKGLELTFNARLVNRPEFSWDVGVNALFLENEVVSLDGDEDIISLINIISEGEEINTFYLIRYLGINPATGEAIHLDENGNITNNPGTNERAILSGKSPNADVEGGFFINFRYKNLRLNSNFVFKEGNYIQNIPYQQANSFFPSANNKSVDAFNYWKNPGDTNTLSNPSIPSSITDIRDQWLQKGDYLRLRTLSLSYDLPQDLLNDLGMSKLRIFLQGQNLLTFSTFVGDPEVGIGSSEFSISSFNISGNPGDRGFVPGSFSFRSYPQLRTVSMGVELTF